MKWAYIMEEQNSRGERKGKVDIPEVSIQRSSFVDVLERASVENEFTI